MWLIACERELTTSCCACSPFLFVYAFGNVVGLPGDSNKNNKCDFQVASDLKRRRKPKKPKREQLWKTDTEQKIPREIPPTDRPCATDGALQVFLLLAFPVCLALAWAGLSVCLSVHNLCPESLSRISVKNGEIGHTWGEKKFFWHCDLRVWNNIWEWGRECAREWRGNGTVWLLKLSGVVQWAQCQPDMTVPWRMANDTGIKFAFSSSFYLFDLL